MSLKNEPLGLPKGSVTAVLVLSLVLPLAVAMFVYVFQTKDIPQSVKEVMLVLIGVASQVIRDYIASRKEAEQIKTDDKPDELKG